MLRFALVAAIVVSSLAPAARGADPASADAKAAEFFETKIRPVLVEQCYKCHSEDAAKEKKLKGGLKLDTKAGLLKGGDTGPSMVPGKADASLLLKTLKYDGDVQMPPKGKLPDQVIKDFEAWIANGAVDPRTGDIARAPGSIDIAKGKQFWSFQAPKEPPVPVSREPKASAGTSEQPPQPNRVFVREYGASDGKQTGLFDFPSDEACDYDNLDILANGRELVVPYPKSQRVQIWDLTDKKMVREFTPTERGKQAWSRVRLSGDGKWISVYHEEGFGHTQLFDWATKTSYTDKRWEFWNQLAGRDMILSSYNEIDSKFVQQKGFAAFNIPQKSLLAKLPSQGDPYPSAISKDGKSFISATSSGDLLVWDLTQIP